MLEKRGQKGKFFRRQKFALLLKRRKIKLSQGAENQISFTSSNKANFTTDCG
jgi:hypothetical protein